jgi:hypothetical protein
MCRKEKFIGAQTAGLTLLGSECSSPDRLGCGLYRRDHLSKGGGYLFQRTTGLLGPDCQ